MRNFVFVSLFLLAAHAQGAQLKLDCFQYISHSWGQGGDGTAKLTASFPVDKSRSLHAVQGEIVLHLFQGRKALKPLRIDVEGFINTTIGYRDYGQTGELHSKFDGDLRVEIDFDEAAHTFVEYEGEFYQMACHYKIQGK